MSRETFTYDNLNVGEYEAMTVAVASGQTIKRGDLLVANADTFSKDTAGAKVGSVYAIAAEDINTTDASGAIVAYFKGKFNREKVTEQASMNSEYVLAAQGIFLVDAR